jgi:UDP-3-O-[3-hydroxymyristoyl] N-acetylglucosamine deacetylase
MTSLSPRRTLMSAATVEGRGLFTGKPARAVFHPAAAGTGVVFRRVDLAHSPPIPGDIGSLAKAPDGIPARNTTLRIGDAEVLTVEHALSALAGLGITDVTIEVEGPELPIGDGSAALFTSALWGAGLRYTGADIEPVRVSREVVITGDKGARITARPRANPGCSYTYELDYGPGGAIPQQTATFDTGRDSYIAAIAPARTFCTEGESRVMKEAGLFAGLTPRDLLVIGAGGPIDNAYRFDNEPARHKVLDLVGDLALCGRPIQAEIVACRSGHAMNQQMARALQEAGR